MVKYQLGFTKAENENRYLTDLTDNITFQNVSVEIWVNWYLTDITDTL